MDFDHRDPSKKLFAITTGSAQLMSRERLIAEIEKCEIVCANCHALRTLASLMERRRRCTPEEWAPGKSQRIESQRARWRRNAAMLNEIRDVRVQTARGVFHRVSCSSITVTPKRRRTK